MLPDIYSRSLVQRQYICNPVLCIALYTGEERRKNLHEIRIHLDQMSSDIRLELTRGCAAPFLKLLFLEEPSSSAADVGSGLCWNLAMSEKIAELVR